MKRGGCHRDDELYRRSICGIVQPQAAPLRRPQVDLIPDCADLMVTATPSNYSVTAAGAVAPADTPDGQDEAIFNEVPSAPCRSAHGSTFPPPICRNHCNRIAPCASGSCRGSC
jgi:hypothetical protein